MSYNATTGKASCDRCGQLCSVGWNTDKVGGFTCGDCLEGRTPLLAELAELKADNAKLLKVADAAGDYLELKAWEEDEDDIEKAGNALADAMNRWKGTGPYKAAQVSGVTEGGK